MPASLPAPAHPCEVTITARHGSAMFRGWCFGCPWKGPKRYTQEEVNEDCLKHVKTMDGTLTIDDL